LYTETSRWDLHVLYIMFQDSVLIHSIAAVSLRI
jgi:hypothetical protein